MLFNSPEYIFFFLPVVIAVYFILNRQENARWGKGWLVLASLAFYGFWNYRYLLLISISIAFNFCIATRAHRNRLVLVTGITFNLLLLFYYKYFNFFLDNIHAALGESYQYMEIILPLGISFFTFQKIAYLVDAYRGEVRQWNFLDFCLFVTFFPQLIAGPIVHHAEMTPQFNDRTKKNINWKNALAGAILFFIGLFKKVILADFFAGIATAGFDHQGEMNFADAWCTSIMYTLQIYLDFSGYSDMAIGAAAMLNIRLPWNFNSPYKASNIQDFWRRWHITLSRWLHAYVYCLFGGNRAGLPRTIFNLWATFVIGGIWHGANWTFLIWGCMHGLVMVSHRLWRQIFPPMPEFFGRILLLLFVNAAWVVFRADDVTTAWKILGAMPDLATFGAWDNVKTIINSGIGITWAAFLQDTSLLVPAVATVTIMTSLAIAFGINSNEVLIRITQGESKIAPGTLMLYCLLAGLSVFILLYSRGKPSPFIYFNF